jgi:hypothetical protein
VADERRTTLSDDEIVTTPLSGAHPHAGMADTDGTDADTDDTDADADTDDPS